MDTLQKINDLSRVQGALVNTIRYLSACDEADAVLNGDEKTTPSALYTQVSEASEVLRWFINELCQFSVVDGVPVPDLPADREEPVSTDAPGTMMVHDIIVDETLGLAGRDLGLGPLAGPSSGLGAILLAAVEAFDCDCVFCAVGNALDAGDVAGAKEAFNALVDLTEESEMVRDHLETVLKELASSDHYPTAVTAAEALAVAK